MVFRSRNWRLCDECTCLVYGCQVKHVKTRGVTKQHGEDSPIVSGRHALLGWQKERYTQGEMRQAPDMRSEEGAIVMSKPPQPTMTHLLIRWLRDFLGVVSIGIGMLGIVMPLIPGVPLLLLGVALLGPNRPCMRWVKLRLTRMIRYWVLSRRLGAAHIRRAHRHLWHLWR